MLNVPESHRDLLQSSVATFATVDSDGRPQLTEVWFLYENDTIALSLNSGSPEGQN